jgi:hypothetical protein
VCSQLIQKARDLVPAEDYARGKLGDAQCLKNSRYLLAPCLLPASRPLQLRPRLLAQLPELLKSLWFRTHNGGRAGVSETIAMATGVTTVTTSGVAYGVIGVRIGGAGVAGSTAAACIAMDAVADIATSCRSACQPGLSVKLRSAAHVSR